MSLIRAWGFKYKTVGFYRVELSGVNSNYFTRPPSDWATGIPEQCLLAVRGKPKHSGEDVGKFIIDHDREHSQKLDQARDRIERLVEGPYLDLFARETKPGWDCWGRHIHSYESALSIDRIDWE
jgi:N6-adenosine-specific RNA methylase IME4